MDLPGRSRPGRRSSTKSSLVAPKHRASTCVPTRTSSNATASTAVRRNSEAPSQCRRPLLTRKSPPQGCSKIPLTELGKQTLGANNLKVFEKRVLRVPSVSTVKNSQFSTDSFDVNSAQKLGRKTGTKFKTAAKENSLNATYCLPSSDDEYTRQIPLKTKSVDAVMLQQKLPNTNVSNSVPEHEQTQLAHCPLRLTEPSYLSPLFSSFVVEECLHIAAELSNKSETCLLHAVDAINPVSVPNVSMINEEPVPLDCSVYSCCSDTSPTKLPLGGSTSQLQEDKDTSCQLILTEAEIKTQDSPVSAKMNDDDVETGTLPWSPSGNLIQINETMMQSDHNDHEGDAPKQNVYSSNVLSKLPSVSNCTMSLSTVDLIQLGEIQVRGASNTQSLDIKTDASCESFMTAKTLSNCNLSLSKKDLLLCERSMLSDENQILPKHRGSFENELEAPALLDCTPSFTTADLIQLNETMIERDNKNITFDLSEHESSFGNNLQVSALSNYKLPLSAQVVVQLNGTMTVDNHKNVTFETSKHEDVGNDLKVTNSSNYTLPPSMRETVQLNGTLTMDDHKNATFDAPKYEGSPQNDSKAPVLSNCELLLQLNSTMAVNDHKNATLDAPKHEGSPENDSKAPVLPSCELRQLNGTMTMDDHKNTTFDAPKHEGSPENDSKAPASSSCELLLQLNSTMTVDDYKNATFDAPKHEGSPENDSKTPVLSNCELLLQLNSTMAVDDYKNATLHAPKHEGSPENDSKAPASSNCELLQLNSTMGVDDYKNATFDAPKHKGSPENDSKAPASSSCELLLQLNGTVTMDDHKNATFDAPKHEGSPENDSKTPVLSNCELLLQLNSTMAVDDYKNATLHAPKHEGSPENDSKAPASSNCELLLQLNSTMGVDDYKNATFDAPKHKGSPENDSKAPASSSCELLLQLNGTMTMDDHKNATFDAPKHEGSPENDSKVSALSNRELLLQLNSTMAVDDHKNATFDAPKHEGSPENDSKASALSNCELLLFTSSGAQLNGIVTVTDCNAAFDTSKCEDSLENNPSKTTNFPNCKLPRSSGGSNEIRLMRKHAPDYGSKLEQVKQNGKSSISNSTLNLGKGGDSTCTNKISSETNQGGDNWSALERSLHLRDTSQNKELSICEHADLVDIVSSEWAPHCMSTPYVRGKQSFPEYLQLDHSFLASYCALQDSEHDGVGECPDEQNKTKGDSESSSIDATETKNSRRKDSNAPRPGQRLQQTKMGTESSLKHVSSLPGVRRKNISQAPVSEAHKSGAHKDSVPPPTRICKVGSTAVGRGGKPPMQPPSFSKICLPKPRLVLGRLSSAIGTGQNAANNKLSSCHIGVNAKMSAKAEPNQPLTKAISKIPGMKKRSSLVSSKLTVQETKVDSKPAELFNIASFQSN
ncbi:uncharacterized protein LOC121281910 isoform X2 [Carcharodon carcharias]|uniref:uncharacterized protein LOC121281910 isoform X2 n=1 Tax=Carcharodon carcharias TaxID=13397 RepID=UPI001B7F4C65|nr:uncharacterized protein LOC121281910 isoform X2 [Carcharodon carcharias]